MGEYLCGWRDATTFTSCVLPSGHFDDGWHLVGDFDVEEVVAFDGTTVRQITTAHGSTWVYDSDAAEEDELELDVREAIASIKKSITESR